MENVEANKTQSKDAKAEGSCHRKQVSINHYKKSDREHILPSGCHQKIEADCKECSVEEMQELESKKNNSFQRIKQRLKIWYKSRKQSQKIRKLLVL